MTSFRTRAASLLRADGERATAVRLDVLDVLAAAHRHLPVAEIHRRVESERPGTNLSTVYRTLDRLAELGLVHGLVAGGETSYGLALEAHHHVTCESCGATVSVPGTAVASLLDSLGALTGMRVSSLDARGWCADCRARAPD